MPRRWFGRLTLLGILLATVSGALLLKLTDGQGVERLQSDIQDAALALGVLRLTLIAGLFIAWPALLRVAQRQAWLSPDTHAHLLARRARLVMWLIALELTLGFDALNHLHALIDWAMA